MQLIINFPPYAARSEKYIYIWGTNLRDDIGAAYDFNKCLRLHSRQSLSVVELFYMIQLKI